MMDTPNDTTLERLFGDKQPAPKLVVQHELRPAAPADRSQPALADDELDDEIELDFYRPYLRKPHSMVAFVVVEKNGTMHSFSYHTLRHPKWEMRGGVELLSFAADGMVVVLEGRGLRTILRLLSHQRLAELREYDEKPGAENITFIRRLEVADPRAQEA